MVVPIIGYIHVCQIGNWRLSYDTIMNAIKCGGLYNNTIEIRVGIVNNDGNIIDDERFHDPKIRIVDFGSSQLYERLTLHNMRNHSESVDCQYWYVHTKGIKFLDDHNIHMKNCVFDWINLMIHWNIINWSTASDKLLSNDVYGCEYSCNPVQHFSGNFWWANSQYIRTLPSQIGSEYCDPEFWLFKRENPLICNIFSSGLDGGDHYFHRFQI